MLANNLLRKMDEIAAKQRQREEEAEARRAAAKISARATAPIPVNTEPETAQATPWRPSGGSWRDREAAKLAGTAANGESSPAPAAPLSERPRFNLAKPTISRDQARIPERLIERDVPEQTSTPAENKAPKLGTYVPPGLRRKQLEVPQSSTPPPQEDKTQSSWGRGMGRRDVSDSKQ